MKIALLLTVLAGVALGTAILTGCHTGHNHSDSAMMCPVSNEKLGSMGKPYVFNHEGHEVKLCCENCKADFMKDPKKYMSKMHH